MHLITPTAICRPDKKGRTSSVGQVGAVFRKSQPSSSLALRANNRRIHSPLPYALAYSAIGVWSAPRNVGALVQSNHFPEQRGDIRRTYTHAHAHMANVKTGG
jgi:hypothetical protein